MCVTKLCVKVLFVKLGKKTDMVKDLLLARAERGIDALWMYNDNDNDKYLCKSIAHI